MSSSRRGSAPILSRFARSCAEWMVKPPEICAPVSPSMPSGFSRKLMNGVEISSLSSRIAKWCEAADGVLQAAVERRVVRPRWAMSAVVSRECPAALVGELHRDDRLATALLVEVLLGVADVRAVQHRVVAQHPPRVDRAGLLLLGRALVLVARDDDALGHLQDLRRVEQALVGEVGLQGLAVLLRDPAVERLLRRLVEGVVDRAVRRVVAVDLRLALRRALDGVVERR